jgi:hypothetical protein
VAIYHLTAKVISRGKGQSAIAAAAYRSGQRLIDEATGAVKHYRARAARIVFAGIFAPKDAPAWARDRQALWNNVHRAERRVDATLAREIELALPHELTDAQRLWLVADFAREAFARRGLVVDVAIHRPHAGDDCRNHHAHFLIVERPVGPGGFARCKDRGLQSRQTLYGWRRDWAALCNRHLARHGHASRIDHRSLKAQGIDREPTKHIGLVATRMERRGIATERGEAVRASRRRNLRRDFAAAQPGAAPTPRRAAEQGQSPAARVTPVVISQRAAYTPSVISGQTAQGFEPGGKVSGSGFRQAVAVLASPMQIATLHQQERVGGLVPSGYHGVESVGQGAAESDKCAVIRCSATQGVEPAEAPETAGDDGGGIGADCAAIHAAYSARIDALRRTLPPDQARAAVQAALEEQRAVIHGIRQRHMREAAGRRELMRRWRRRQRALMEARTA